MKNAAKKPHPNPLPSANVLLESWTSLANESAEVVTSRIAQLPWMWLRSPATAEAETRRMFSEKQDAMLETQWVLWQMPAQFWADAFANDLMFKPDQAIQSASKKANQRLIGPSHKRVSANRKRLSKTK